MSFYTGLHKRQKKLLMGYKLTVLIDKEWTPVEGCFGSRREAAAYASRHYGAGARIEIQSLRFNCVPVVETYGSLK